MTVQCPKCGAWIDSSTKRCVRCREDLTEFREKFTEDNANTSIRSKKTTVGERVGAAFGIMIACWGLGWLFTLVISVVSFLSISPRWRRWIFCYAIPLFG
jgi:hypothetical protein